MINYINDEKFYHALIKLIIANNRDAEKIEFKKFKNYKSLYINSNKLCHFVFVNQKNYMCLNNTLIDEIIKNNIPYKKMKAKSEQFAIRINIDDLNVINDFAKFWIEMYDRLILKNNGNVYSCCSHYIECSNSLKCLYNNEKDSLLCKYKTNLERGLIFYGDNAIFDETGNRDEDKIKSNLNAMKKININKIEV